MRKVVNLIPFKRTEDGTIQVFLQKRSKDAKVRPDLLGLFGGGKDAQNSLTALFRETKEELGRTPLLKNMYFLGVYIDEIPSEKEVFCEEVDESFENRITVREGQYGAFFTPEDVGSSEEVSASEKQIIADLVKKYQL